MYLKEVKNILTKDNFTILVVVYVLFFQACITNKLLVLSTEPDRNLVVVGITEYLRYL